MDATTPPTGLVSSNAIGWGQLTITLPWTALLWTKALKMRNKRQKGKWSETLTEASTVSTNLNNQCYNLQLSVHKWASVSPNRAIKWCFLLLQPLLQIMSLLALHFTDTFICTPLSEALLMKIILLVSRCSLWGLCMWGHAWMSVI